MRAEPSIVGVEGVLGTLAGAARLVSDVRPLDPILTNALHAHVALTIETGNEGTYPALKPETVRRKERAGQGGNPILVATGTMAGAATSDNAPDSVHYATETEIVNGLTGRSGEIANFHQYGTDNMAARPLYANMARFADEADGLIHLYYGEAFVGLGIEVR